VIEMSGVTCYCSRSYPDYDITVATRKNYTAREFKISTKKVYEAETRSYKREHAGDTNYIFKITVKFDRWDTSER
jgi:hypothetical protein